MMLPPANAGWRQRLRGFFVERLGLESLAALAAKKRVPIHRATVFYFLGGMALFLFVIQVITGIAAGPVLQTFPRPGLRKRARDHDGGGFRLAHPLDPLLERQFADRRAFPPRLDDLHHACLPASA